MKSSLIKEQTKARMLKNAARLWGAEDVDIELNFDPLVAILIEGCINEIEKVGNEINNTHARVISRLAQLLTPNVVTSSLPAHAVIHARPSETRSELTQEAQFYYTKKIPSEINPKLEINKDLFFAPVLPVKIINGDVKYFAFHDRAYEISNVYQKSIVAVSENETVLETGSLWMGLELHSNVKDMDEMIFYFDLRNNPFEETFLNLLPNAKLSVDGIILPVEDGFSQENNIHSLQLEDEFSPDKRIEADVRTSYERHFKRVSRTTKDLIDIELRKKAYPEIFTKIFSDNDLQKLKGRFLWIKVDFASAVTEEMLSDIYCNINCFPVVNKKHNELTFRLSQHLDIVPLQTQDNFFSIKKVLATDGFEYSSNPIEEKRNYTAGTFTMRQGGIERFDRRNAVELINYLLNLLRDESAAFTILGNDFLSGYLKQLNQILAVLEQRSAGQSGTHESTFYLVVNPRNEVENIFVSFWTTNGELANNIKAGNKLDLYNGDVQGGSMVFLTTSAGGKDKLDDIQRLNAFKQSFISRGRIVTRQDIKMFCVRELGTSIDDVRIKKGYFISDTPKEGFVQTIDVILKVNQDDKVIPAEWNARCLMLGYKLRQLSSGITPFRVFTEKKYQEVYQESFTDN